MNRVLLLLDNKRNRTLLADWLGQRYDVIQADQNTWTEMPFDLCLIDGTTLDRLGQGVRMKKAEEEPVFLPVVLVTSHREAELITRHLWQTVDELIHMPIEKLELLARVEVLLRARRLSLDLRLRNEELEAFFHAMSHDVRAPLRAIRGFAQLLQAGESERLSAQGRHDLDQIQAAAGQMQEIVNGLIDFARIEYGDQQVKPLSLDLLIRKCLDQMVQEIEQRHAAVVIRGPFPHVLANKLLLTSAITNLLSNAMKFVARGARPVITIQAIVAHHICHLEIQDNGIGIALDDQTRLFRPFTQLHSSEVYEGIGLGLATVRKAMELMKGRCGVVSAPGQGSTFWLELPLEE